MPGPLLANLICGSPRRNHDYDWARVRLLDMLYAAGDIRTDCAQNYDDSAAIENGDLLISYTSQVPVAEAQCQALRRYLDNGGRWFALHGSNSVLGNPHLPSILGSSFVIHPPYSHFAVSVTKPNDPLMRGIEPFEVDDERYVMDMSDGIEVLLHTQGGGEVAGDRHFADGMRPLMYRHRVGKGGVLYLALGHANRPFDTQRPEPVEDHRGPWAMPVYQELLRRGIEWAAKRRPL